MRYILFLAGIIFGTVVIVYTKGWMRIFGSMDWAERLLGGGGTYMAWKIIGVGSIFAALLMLRYGSVLGI